MECMTSRFCTVFVEGISYFGIKLFSCRTKPVVRILKVMVPCCLPVWFSEFHAMIPLGISSSKEYNKIFFLFWLSDLAVASNSFYTVENDWAHSFPYLRNIHWTVSCFLCLLWHEEELEFGIGICFSCLRGLRLWSRNYYQTSYNNRCGDDQYQPGSNQKSKGHNRGWRYRDDGWRTYYIRVWIV